MRTTHAVVALALWLCIVHAQEQQTTFDTSSQQQSQQQQQPQQPEEEPWQVTADDYPFKPTEPSPPTADEVTQAKSGLQQLMAELNLKHVEPLFNTMDGYCTAFKGLCTAACAERIKLSKTQDRRDGEIAVEDASDYAGGQEVKGCIDPQAQTVASAGAMCHVGGIVTSESSTTSSSSDFAAQGILDSLTYLPAVPTFLNIIHVMQNVCFYIGFLDILATNPHPASCPINPLGAIASLIPGLGPVLGQLIPGLVPTPALPIPGLGGIFGGSAGESNTGGGTGEGNGAGGDKKNGGIGDLLGGIIGGSLGGGKNGGGGEGLGIIGDIVGGIFGGGNKPQASVPLPMPEPVAPPPPTTPPGLRQGEVPGILMSPPKPRDKLFGLFSDDDTQYSQEASESDKHEVEESRGADRLVSHDGRVAKIVRMKKRGQAKKADKNERGDFV
ncbi:hypothetical protein BGZ81_011093 [Podila clonocystis]|nr:hypothetical protein BGZ81_011093 [Podila clonocystis]